MYNNMEKRSFICRKEILTERIDLILLETPELKLYDIELIPTLHEKFIMVLMILEKRLSIGEEVA